jgi:hypothetical protein
MFTIYLMWGFQTIIFHQYTGEMKPFWILIVHITYKIEFDQSKNKPQDEIFSYLKESLYTIYSYSVI